MKIKSIKRILLDEPVAVYDVINAAPNNNFLIRTNSSPVVAHNCFLDEISFARNQDIGRQMEKAKEVFDAALERIQSRFTKFGGIFDGLIVMASSKRTDQAFAEVYAKELLSGKNGYRTFIVDKPRWEVLPKGTYSGETFPLALGDTTRPTEIITKDKVPEYEKAGYRIIYPPIETYDEFKRDLMHALTNIAGESVTQTGTFLQAHYVKECIDSTRENPFREGIIYVGAKDDRNYWDYFDMSKVDPEDLSKPLYIHLDASLGKDGNSISAGNISYAKHTLNLETGLMEPELHYKQVFKIKVRAPKGDRVMLRKNEQFIYWLRAQGFNIALVTSDQYQSAQFGQDLTAAGINYRYQSIDAVTRGVNQPYSVLKNAIYDKRISLLDDKDQFEELISLVQYENGRVDKNMKGISDDAAQTLAGWVYAASLNKENYIRTHAVLGSTYIGSTYAERRIVEESNVDPALITELVKNEFGAVRVSGSTGLRQAYEESFRTGRTGEEPTTPKRSPFHFF
jgi:hypothetical protein